jgi:hypothetical protein
MKNGMSHTTNYFNTFILVADDCPVTEAEIPPVKGDKKSIANLQFEMIYNNPYKFTSDEVIFSIYAHREGIPQNQFNNAREEFFSKGQACFRASPLCKRYGWGLHSDEAGKIALIPSGTQEYKNFSEDRNLTTVKAMRSKKA